MRAYEFISEATNQHKIPDFSVPIIPDNMPFGKNFGGGGGGTFKGGGTSTSPPANTKAPPVKNSIFPALVGRPKPEDVTHAYRTMNPAELQHAQSTGYFTAKNPENRKWWTAHTANPKGFGGLEKSSEPSIQTQVRVPIGKVPSDTAVHAGHAEYWNRETGQWTPAVSGLPKK